MFAKKIVISTAYAFSLSLHLSALILVLICISCRPDRSSGADLVLVNGKIITVDSAFSIVEAVAIHNGRFVSVGTTEEVNKWISPATRILDLKGHTAIPGIIEGHAHLVAASQSELSELIPAVSNMEELLSWIAQQAQSKKAGEWIVHPKFFFTRLDEMRAPTLEELDAVAPEHPVFLNGSYGGMVNTKALEISGLTASNHPGLLRDKFTGKHNGSLFRSAFELLALPQPNDLTFEEKRAALKAMLARYNEVGITSVILGRSDKGELALFEALLADDELTARLYLNFAFPFSPKATLDEIKASISQLGFRTGDGNEWIKVGALKAVVDGGILTGTAFLREPWSSKAQNIFGRSADNYQGELYLNQRELAKLIIAADDAGWNFTAHVTGGGAVDTLLAAFEEVGGTRTIRDKRFSIIHGNFYTPQAIAKMRDLGIYANMQAAWLYMDGDFINAVSNDERTDFHPYKSLYEAKVQVIGGSDHMVKTDPNSAVNPYNPFLSIATVVNRKTRSGLTFNAAERISRQEALKMYTINNAHASFEEDIKGSIERDKLADMVVLSADILSCPEDEIKDIFPILTIIGGKEVFDKGILTADNDPNPTAYAK